MSENPRVPFHLACEHATERKTGTKEAKRQRELWGSPVAVPDSELHWHLEHLVKREIQCEDPILLSIALCSIRVWGIMTQAIPWIGRYSLSQGVSYRVITFFTEQMPIYKTIAFGSINYARSFKGRKHGLRFESKSQSVEDLMHCVIPWAYGDVPTPGNISIELWDRGRQIKMDNTPFQLETGSKTTVYNTIYIRWAKRGRNKIEYMTITPYKFIHCEVCDNTVPEVTMYTSITYRWFDICSHCKYIAPCTNLKGGRPMRAIEANKENYTLESVGLDDYPIPMSPIEGILMMQHYSDLLRDSGKVQMPPPPKRRIARKSQQASNKRQRTIADCAPSGD